VAESILPAFFQRVGASDALLGALRIMGPTPAGAAAALRVMNERGFQHPGLHKLLFEAANSSRAEWAYSPEAAANLAAEATRNGDAARGAQIFRRAELTCVACHAIGGEGGVLGPALDSIGTAQPLDFVVGAVLAPQREVKESYDTVEIALKDGGVMTGFRAGGDAGEIALREPGQTAITRVRRDRIAAEKSVGSIMPAGLVNGLSKQELLDLFRYLSELGRPR
jgi:putative heme-binding domain-containing protein